MIANDSGPLHIAAALGCRLLGLFGPTLPERSGPYPLSAARNHVLTAPGGEMQRLNVDTVFQDVCRIIESQKNCRAA